VACEAAPLPPSGGRAPSPLPIPPTLALPTSPIRVEKIIIVVVGPMIVRGVDAGILRLQRLPVAVAAPFTPAGHQRRVASSTHRVVKNNGIVVEAGLVSVRGPALLQVPQLRASSCHAPRVSG